MLVKNNSYLYCLGLGFILVIIAACAPISKEQCNLGDWYGIGLSDGMAGHTLSRLTQIQKKCAKTGVVVDLNQYKAGRSEGLKQFCTPQTAFSRGSKGYSNNNVCPSNVATKFNTAYGYGYALYAQKKKIKNIDSEIANVSQDLGEATEQDDDYYRLQRQLRRLAKEQSRLSVELGHMIAKTEIAMAKLLSQT